MPIKEIENQEKLQDVLNSPQTDVKSDQELGDNENIGRRNILYTDLLREYTNNVKDSLQDKRFQKRVFFWFSFGLMSAITLLLIVVVVFCIRGCISGGLLEIVAAAAVSFLTVMIVIPHTITNYLFNAKEEEAMVQVLSNIKDYDIIIRGNPKK